MLFYEWRSNKGSNIQRDQVSKPSTCTSASSTSPGSSNSMTPIPVTATTTSSNSEPPVTSSSYAGSATCTSVSSSNIGNTSCTSTDNPSSSDRKTEIESVLEATNELSEEAADSSNVPLPRTSPPNIRDVDQTEKLIQKQHPGEVSSVVDNLSNLSKCDIDVKPSLRSSVGVVPSLTNVSSAVPSSSAPSPLAALQATSLSILPPSGPLLGPSMLQSPSSSSYSSISSLSALTATAGGNVGIPLSAVVQQSTISSALQPCSSSSASSSGSVTTLASGPSLGLGLGLVRIGPPPKRKRKILSKELEEWIWQDNRHFLQDRNIFEHTYFK